MNLALDGSRALKRLAHIAHIAGFFFQRHLKIFGIPTNPHQSPSNSMNYNGQWQVYSSTQQRISTPRSCWARRGGNRNGAPEGRSGSGRSGRMLTSRSINMLHHFATQFDRTIRSNHRKSSEDKYANSGKS